MATTVYTNNQHYSDIAAAIRNKNGTNTTYKPSEMAAAINALIVSGASINLQAKTVSPTTSQQVVTYDNAYNGLSQVTVNAIQTETKSATPSTSAQTITPASGKYLTSVSIAAIQTETKSATPSTSTQNITPSSGKYLTKVTVNPIPSNYIVPTGSYSIVANGTGIDIAQYATVDVNVPTGSTINNQNKTVTPLTAQQSITFDSGYTGLGTVTVEAMPAMTLPGTAAASATSGFASKATIGRSTSDQYINIPTGYNSAGVYYKISAVANGTAGTPTATKGTVSDNSIQVTPSVTNTTGYITGGTKIGTAVTVSASELVSGTLNITSNGTKNVTNYASVNVNVPTGSTINNQNKSVTPTESAQSITYDSGYTGLGTVTVGAISPTYVGSNIEARDDTDLDVSGATVTIPEGYYAQAESVSVATTTHPAPTATINTSTGVVTATHTQTAGYVDADTKTNTLNLTTQAAKTVTPSSSSQTAVAANRYTTGVVTVAAVPTETKSVTSNGTYTPSSGKWFSSVTVNVPVGATINNQDKTVSPSTTLQTITYDSGYTGLETVTVNAIETETATINQNGTYIPSTGKYFSSVTVNVQGVSSAISVVDTADAAGGTIRTITAVDISDTTAVANDVAQGKYFYTADGTKTVGTASNSITEITIPTSGAVTQELQADTIYHFTSTALTSLTITFAGTGNEQYHFDFISPSTAITLTLPQTVIMSNNFTVEANTKYEIDILNNYGVFAEWAVS